MSLNISNSDLKSLAEKHVVVTGASSGIGLATVKLLLASGAVVTVGGQNAPSVTHEQLVFVHTDVASWISLTNLFKQAVKRTGQIDHVFANAGIASNHDYVNSALDEHGDPVEPAYEIFDINIKAVCNTCALAVHYIRKNGPASGASIVINTSGAAFQKFRNVDYGVSKHAVLGLARNLGATLEAGGVPIRVNAVAPSWTVSPMIPDDLLKTSGVQGQEAFIVARAVALLMADEGRANQVIYSARGVHKEIEQSTLARCVPEILGDEEDFDTVLAKMFEAAKKLESTEQGTAQKAAGGMQAADAK